MSLSMEERLKRRKLDALKRGVHRLKSDEIPQISTHVVGIGKAGAGTIAELLRSLKPNASKLFALAIDIGDTDLAELRLLAASMPTERAEITIAPLDVPKRGVLIDGLQQYPEFLKLEYPLYRWNSSREPWLTPTIDLPKAGSHINRAVAKAIYGLAYYGGSRELEGVLRRFAASVDAVKSQAAVAVVFGIGGGTGSGIAVDLTRHLSNRLFGRRVLVAGIGIGPCDGDPPEQKGGHLFPVFNELDCLVDERKNSGVVTTCGELFRNPFTAGFIMIPQQHMWECTRNLAATQARGNQEVATLLTWRDGASLWEILRLLNWVAAPSTQHSAARTPWGDKWIHMLGFANASGRPISIGPALPKQMGLLPTYKPEFIEARVPSAADASKTPWAHRLEEAFAPDVEPQIADGAEEDSVQFILPSISKSDLSLFHEARTAYDSEDQAVKILDHSLLLDQGILLSEPSTRVQAGASLRGSDSWIAVPLSDLRGGEWDPHEQYEVG
jgi:hypothetical protein